MKKIAIILPLFVIQSILLSQPYTIADYVGNWTGAWNNTTFNTTGPATMSISSNSTNMTAEMMLDLDGNVFGGTDPDPMNLTGNYTDTEFTVSAQTDLFGDFTLTVDNQGIITGEGLNVPSEGIDKIEFSGTSTPTQMNIDYTIFFSDAWGGGNAYGVLTFGNKTPLSVNNTDNLLDDFRLEQNFPNPFNPTTSINFNLPNDSYTTLSIYNILGEQVIQLVDQYMMTGEHTITWDGRDQFGNLVSGGAYIYNLKVGETNITKKMIFLR